MSSKRKRSTAGQRPPASSNKRGVAVKREREEEEDDDAAARRRRRLPPLSIAAQGGEQQQPDSAMSSPEVVAATTAAAIVPGGNSSSSSSSSNIAELRERFIQVFSEPEFQTGISNSALKERFGADTYLQLVPIINELTQESRLTMSQTLGGSSGVELFYTLVSNEVASKFSGLDVSARMVYQVIEKAGDMGIWTKDIRLQTNIQQQALNKIFKALENRQLIKPVKSVTQKAKKLYMLYNLTPSKELTGGVWYSDLEFDHEFISELRTFLLHCIRRLNEGRGVTLVEIRDKMVQANVSRVQLSLEEIKQLVQTLVYDYLVEQHEEENGGGEPLYVHAKRVTTMCEFKWWDALEPDFHFRTIEFEDGVTVGPQEPHYHTA